MRRVMLVSSVLMMGTIGGRHPELTRDQLQILAAQQPQDRLPLAIRRHPPPAVGAGPSPPAWRARSAGPAPTPTSSSILHLLAIP